MYELAPPPGFEPVENKAKPVADLAPPPGFEPVENKAKPAADLAPPAGFQPYTDPAAAKPHPSAVGQTAAPEPVQPSPLLVGQQLPTAITHPEIDQQHPIVPGSRDAYWQGTSVPHVDVRSTPLEDLRAGLWGVVNAHNASRMAGNFKVGAVLQKEYDDAMAVASDPFADPMARAKAQIHINSLEKRLGRTTSGLQKDVENFVGVQQRINAIPMDSEAVKFLQSKTMGEATDQLAKHNTRVYNTIALRAGPSAIGPTIAGIVGGILGGPLGAAIGSGGGSGAMDFGATINEGVLDVLHKQGISPDQLKDPAILKAFWEKNGEAIINKAMIRAGIIGGVDAISGGLSNKIAGLAMSKFRKIGLDAGVETVAGPTGEALAQKATGEYKPGEILAEGFLGPLLGAARVSAQIPFAQRARGNVGTPVEEAPRNFMNKFAEGKQTSLPSQLMPPQGRSVPAQEPPAAASPPPAPAQVPVEPPQAAPQPVATPAAPPTQQASVPQQPAEPQQQSTAQSVGRATPGVTVIRHSDGREEVRRGARNWRNHNPGNIEYGNFARSHGAIGTDGRFAVFPDYATGRRAKEALLFESRGYRNKTIAGAIARYAPQFENNTAAYTNSVASAVGVPSNTPLSSLSAEQRQRMLDAMERVEGFRVGHSSFGSDFNGRGTNNAPRIASPTPTPPAQTATPPQPQVQPQPVDTPTTETPDNTAAVLAATADPPSQAAPAPAGPTPVTFDDPSVRVAPGPDTTNIVATQSFPQVETKPVVVDLANIIASDDPRYDQGLQPRNRGDRVASEVQIADIASQLNPARLMPGPEASSGAPIINSSGMVESGNGRTMAIRQAYQRNLPGARAYRQQLAAQGYNVEGMAMPILVQRRTTEMTPEQVQQFVREANASTVMRMSAPEQAVSDAKSISPEMLSALKDRTNIAKNSDFVRKFIQMVPKSEQSDMTDANGNVSAAGVRRMQNAVFAAAYGDSSVLSRVSESTDDNTKSLLQALMAVAPEWAALGRDIEAGKVPAEFDLRKNLVEAVERISDMRDKGQKLNTYLSQQDAFDQMSSATEMLMRLFYNEAGTRALSKERVSDALRFYAQEARKVSAEAGLDLGLPAVKPNELVETATRKAQDGGDNQGQSNLFAESGDVAERAPRALADRATGGSQVRRQAASERSDARDRGNQRADDEGRDESARQSERSRNARDENQQGGDRPGALADDGRQTRTTDTFTRASFTRRQSYSQAAWIDAGMDPDVAANLNPPERFRVLAKMFNEKYGIKVSVKKENTTRTTGAGRKIDTVAADVNYSEAVDQLLDAYHNMAGLAEALNMPINMFSLGGNRLTLSLSRFSRKTQYLGAYDPATRTIELPGRSNSLAHEWFHAADHYLTDKLIGDKASISDLMSRIARTDGIDFEPANVQEAFVNLLYTTIFNKDAYDNYVSGINKQANETLKTGKRKGQPTKKAEEAIAVIDKLFNGNLMARIQPSDFRKSAAEYSANVDYWASAPELLARAFEAYAASKLVGMPNETLTKGDASYLSNENRRFALTFPKDTERALIFKAFDDLFDIMRAEEILGSGATATATDSVRVNVNDAYKLPTRKNGWKELIKSPAKETWALIRQSRAHNRKLIAKFGWKNYIKRYGLALSPAFYSAAGQMHAIANQYVGTKAHGWLSDIAYSFGNVPGKNTYQGETYLEAAVSREQATITRISNVLESNNLLERTDEQNDILTKVLTGQVSGERVPENIAKVAGAIRRELDKLWYDQNNAGIKLAYEKRSSYLPRAYVIDRIEADRNGFIAGAEKAYLDQWNDDKKGALGDRTEEHVADVAKVIANSDVKFLTGTSDPNGVKAEAASYSKALSELQAEERAAIKRAESAAKDGEFEASEKAEREAEKAREKIDDLVAEMEDFLKPVFANSQANHFFLGAVTPGSTDFDTRGPSSDNKDQRVLPPSADKHLAAFMNPDPIERVQAYVGRASKRVAYVERAGTGGGVNTLQAVYDRAKKQGRIKFQHKMNTPLGRLTVARDFIDPATDDRLAIYMKEAADAGALRSDTAKLQGTVEIISGRNTKRAATNVPKAVDNAATIMTSMMLARAVVASIPEMGSMGIVTGRPLEGWVVHAEAFRQLTDKERSRAVKEYGQMLGSLSSPLFNPLISAAHGGELQSTSKIVQNIANSSVKGSGLEALTDFQRRTVLAHTHFSVMPYLFEQATQSQDTPSRQAAIDTLKGLGIEERNIQTVADWHKQIADENRMPTAEETWYANGGPGEMYAVAMRRFVSQVIQMPTAERRPVWASTPWGRHVYGITSFLTSAFSNLFMAPLRKGSAAYEASMRRGHGRGWASYEFAKSFGSRVVFGYFGTLYVLTFPITTMMAAMFSGDQWEEESLKQGGGVPWWWLADRNRERSAPFGLFNVLENSIRGLRYDKPLSQLAVGPAIGTSLGVIQTVGKVFTDKNSKNTNTAEHKAIQQMHQLITGPLLHATTHALGGPFIGAALSAAGTGAAANRFVADRIVGTIDSRKTRMEKARKEGEKLLRERRGY